MSVRVIKAGLFDTIQDGGRYGFALWGVNPNGAMDKVALQIGNALVGNDANAAVLECHYPAPELHFSKPAIISITGADFGATVNHQHVPAWRCITVPQGATLRFTAHRSGMRAYLAIHGGFEVQPWLGSTSTNVKSGVGGFAGRRIVQGDELAFKNLRTLHVDTLSVSTWSVNAHALYADIGIVQFVAGKEWKLLDAVSQQTITTHPVFIKPSSDRMALQLAHQKLSGIGIDLRSSAVAMGTMQLLPSGDIIVLMADHQTTGGYPRLGHVITVCMHQLAQRRPGDPFQFQMVSMLEAEKSLFSMQTEVNRIITSVYQHFNKQYAIH